MKNNIEFKKLIKSWSKKTHKRNILICIEICKGRSFKETGREFNLSESWIGEIFHKGMNELAAKIWNVLYVSDSSYLFLKYEKMLPWIEEYNIFYENTKND